MNLTTNTAGQLVISSKSFKPGSEYVIYAIRTVIGKDVYSVDLTRFLPDAKTINTKLKI